MSHAITRCPKCGTSFRVTAPQLDSANGAVRCGSCLHVFDARSNFIDAAEHDQPAKRLAASQQPPASPAPSAAAPSKPEQPATSVLIDDGDDFLISDDMALPGEEPAKTQLADDTGESEVDSNIDLGELAPEFRESNKKAESGNQPADADSEEEAIDESWAHALLEELDSELAEADEDANERLRREIDNRFDGRQTGSFDVLQEE